MGKELDLDFRSPAEEACAVMLGWDPMFRAVPPPLDAGAPALRGYVSICLRRGGDTRVVVAIDSPGRDAVAVARALLGAPDDEDLPPEDLRDAFGELVNVIGGNIKGMIEEAVRLSIPTVQLNRSWRQLDADLPGQLLFQMWLAHEGHHLRMTVLANTGTQTNKGQHHEDPHRR